MKEALSDILKQSKGQISQLKSELSTHKVEFIEKIKTLTEEKKALEMARFKYW